MGERRDTPREVSRSFVPDRKYWTSEAAARFLDDEGRLQLHDDGTPQFEPLPMPLIDAQTYPIVDIPAFTQALKGLFVPGARFPKVYEKRKTHEDSVEGMDVTTVTVIPIPAPDNIDHVQGIVNFVYRNGDVIDRDMFAFCDGNERKIKLPWHVHNVKTAVFDNPPGPRTGLDRDLVLNHMKGHDLSLDVLEAAVRLFMSHRMHGIRKRAISDSKVRPATPIIPHYGIDEGAAIYLADKRKDFETDFRVKLETFDAEMPPDSYFARFVEDVSAARLKRIIHILSGVATRSAWDYSDFYRGHVDEQRALSRHKNRFISRTARDARLAA